jgi:CRP-like cAMP-binding protein
MPLCSSSDDERDPTTWANVFAKPVEWRVGASLFRQGDVPRQVFAIERGFAKVQAVDEDGDECLIDVKGPGTLLGISSLFSRQPYQAAAVAGSPCVVRIADLDVVEETLSADPNRTRAILGIAARDTRRLTERVISLALKSSTRRLLRELRANPLALASTRGHLTQAELASLMAVTPEHLSRVLRQMVARGVICRERRRIVVKTA